MRRFCENCGALVNADGTCPNCDKKISAREPLFPTAGTIGVKKSGTSFKKIMRRIFIGFMVFLIVHTCVTVTLGLLVYYDKLDIPVINDILVHWGFKEESYTLPTEPENVDAEEETDTIEEETDINGDDSDMLTPYEITPPDADEFFNKNSTVAATIPANDSPDVHSESEAYDNFEERGFADNPITTEYSMEGEYTEPFEIYSHSSNKHPMYQTYYITSNEDVWLIAEINGAMIATPISYNEQAQTVPVMISETPTITSYDSTTNKFYVTTPNPSVISVKTIERIDAATLETLTNGAIDRL